MSQLELDNKKIAKNTIFLYGRLLFTMAISLYSSRLILDILGVTDFGIYNVVGGVVGIMSLLSAAFSNSAQRFISYRLGENNFQKLHITFLTILNIHFLFVILIIVFGETIGLWFINTKLVIPVERLTAANIVYQCSLLTVVIDLISIPYIALIMSHERLNFYAIIGILESILKLGGIILLYSLSYDSLSLYSLLLFLIAIIIRIIYGIYSKRNFEESKYKLLIDKIVFKEIWGYVSWAYLGNFAGILKEQGLNVIINIFFGVTVNAARAVSMQVYNAINGLSGNILTAINPQIVKSYAVGNISRSQSLTSSGTRYSIYLLTLISMPILIETSFLLHFWLTEVPGKSVIFVQLIIALCFSRVIQHPTAMLYLAVGKIKMAQIWSSIIVVVSIIACYFLFKLGFSPESSIWISIISETINFIVLLYLLNKEMPFNIFNFLKETFFRVSLVLIFSCILPLLLHNNFQEGLLRFLLVSFSSFFSTVCLVFFIGITKEERSIIRNYIWKKIKNEKYEK